MFCVIFIVVHCSLMMSQSVLLDRENSFEQDEILLNIRSITFKIPVIMHCYGEAAFWICCMLTWNTQRQIIYHNGTNDDEFGLWQ